MKPLSEITAAVLAGGEGRRVEGQDKGLLLLAGQSLVARVVEGLRAQADRVLICANRSHGEYAQYGDVIADAESGFKGPLAAIAVALARCETPWLLTVPVDEPELPRDLAARLFDVAIQANAAAAVAQDGTRRQPLFALYRHDLAQSAAQALERGLGPWRWQDEIGAIEVDFSDQPQSFVNLNTLEDFREWERRHDL